MKKLNFSKRNYLASVFVLGSVVLVLAMLGTSPSGTSAQEHSGPVVITPDYVAFGGTYGEWSAAWWQWAFSVPVASHPLFDNTDCSTGQSGSVWFLGAKSCIAGSPNCSVGSVTRSCSVPAGKAPAATSTEVCGRSSERKGRMRGSFGITKPSADPEIAKVRRSGLSNSIETRLPRGRLLQPFF